MTGKADLITRYYAAFNAKDWTGMAACVSEDLNHFVNGGDKQVSGLSIRVNALDEAGNVVRTVVTPPLAQTIAPSGGRATFEALMPRDAAVAGYHAVAIAR